MFDPVYAGDACGQVSDDTGSEIDFGGDTGGCFLRLKILPACDKMYIRSKEHRSIYALGFPWAEKDLIMNREKKECQKLYCLIWTAH